MKVRFRPEGGRFGYGFDYFCAECGLYVGNTNDETLVHDVTETKGIFKKTITPIASANAGKISEIPKHEIEAPDKKDNNDCRELGIEKA